MRFLLETCVLVAVGSAFGVASIGHAEEIRPYFLMDREPPEVPEEPILYLNPELIPMWKRALAQSESELKRQAAEAIVHAHRFGHEEALSTVDDLLRVLTDEKVHPAARHAAAHALVVLGSRSSAPQLMDVSQKNEKDLRQLVEPALAEWNFESMRPVWRARVASADTSRQELMLAINGLGQQQDADALQGLLALTMKRENPADVRLAAARAAARVANQGLEPQAEKLLAHGLILDRLCAVSLISLHRSEQAIRMHQTSGVDAEPAVAAVSLQSLFAINPKLVLPITEAALQNPDANVRRIGIETYLVLPTVERVKTLSLKLNDPHPKLRGRVRDGFFELSKDSSLDPTIRQSTIKILQGNDWRGQEQAALLLGALNEESAAPRLIDLLDSKRSEVMISTAWSLKMLEIPETATPVQAFAQMRTDNSKFTTAVSLQVAHLFELLGRLKSTPAIPLLEVYLPKTDKYGVPSRAAAVWALGVVQEGQTNEPLAKKLLERYMDTMSSPPEYYDVRRTAVLSLGRIRATNQVATLKQTLGDTVDQDWMELTVRHAIRQITGEILPIAPPFKQMRAGWFLEPVTRPQKSSAAKEGN